MTQRGNNWEVTGVCSWGSGCAERNAPGVYANAFSKLMEQYELRTSNPNGKCLIFLRGPRVDRLHHRVKRVLKKLKTVWKKIIRIHPNICKHPHGKNLTLKIHKQVAILVVRVYYRVCCRKCVQFSSVIWCDSSPFYLNIKG